MRLALVFLAACGIKSATTQDAPTHDSTHDSGADGAAVVDARPVTHDSTPLDAPGFPYKLDLGINCHNDCTLIANPPSIAVTAGTKFTVNWINTGDTDCDVAKIDQFNQVPIVLGLEPGTSYYDSIREWCGPFTGTFEFRISICDLPSYIPVNCGV
jgi:hypothetical protein